jgi:hypothetical protein
MTVQPNSWPIHASAPYGAQPLGYQQITSFSSATSLTVPNGGTPTAPTFALINVEGTPGTDTVRWRDDGTAPTTSVGMLVNGTGSSSWPPFRYSGDLTAIQFIAAAGSPKLNVAYYR